MFLLLMIMCTNDFRFQTSLFIGFLTAIPMVFGFGVHSSGAWAGFSWRTGASLDCQSSRRNGIPRCDDTKFYATLNNRKATF